MFSRVVAFPSPHDYHGFATVLSAVQGYIVAVLGGLLVGGLLAAAVRRLPAMLERRWQHQIDALVASRAQSDPRPAPTVPDEPLSSLWMPRAACAACGHRMRLFEAVPVPGFLLLRGRCPSCRAPLDPASPLLQLATAAFAVLALWRFGPHWQALFGFGLAAALLALAAIDATSKLLPDALTLPLLWAGLLVNRAALFASPNSAVIGAAAGYLALWAGARAFRYCCGREGLGQGDFKLLAALGAWFGWRALPHIVFVATSAGAAVGLAVMLIRPKRRDAMLPFGPFLAAAALWMLFGGHTGLLFTV
ncbi:prepilin peptidase [Burkholderia sp. WAC0059]|nr:prepilin peptidase [Burkholderia sp. WAC0059]